MTNGDSLTLLFAPLIGQMAWNARSDAHGCVMMEFGAPHLDIREPRLPSPGASPVVARILTRRAVHVVGDWHLWIESGNWALTTRNGAASSADETGDAWREWMADLSGRHLVAAESPAPGALVLQFDSGIVLEARPADDAGLDSWSLYRWQGDTVTCSADGSLKLHPPTDG